MREIPVTMTSLHTLSQTAAVMRVSEYTVRRMLAEGLLVETKRTSPRAWRRVKGSSILLLTGAAREPAERPVTGDELRRVARRFTGRG